MCRSLYLESLGAIGIDLRQHDIKFEEDNWEAPTLSAWGVGWQVMLDGLEITQFTYFQQCGGVDLFPISRGADLRAGAHRRVSCRMWIRFTTSCGRAIRRRASVVKYGDVRLADELQFSVYNFEEADVREGLEAFRFVRGGVQGR